MRGYTKLFYSILTSTIWREDDKTRIVWITLLALADKDGIAEGSVPGLADIARVSVEDCRAALEKLKSPDPDSRTKDNEGRRIMDVDGGWFILNHKKFREKMSQDERREYNRKKQAEYRQRLSADVNNVNDMSAVPSVSVSDSSQEEGVQRKPKRERFSPPSLEEVKLEAAKIGLPDAEADKFHSYYEANGWRVGRNPMKSWPAALVHWRSNWQERQHEHPKNSRPSSGGIDRNAGTFNEGHASDYANGAAISQRKAEEMRRAMEVQDVQRTLPGTGS